MKNQLSENQLTEISNVFILIIKANNVENFDVSLIFKGKGNSYILQIFHFGKLIYKEKFYVQIHTDIFDWIMTRWRKELLQVIRQSQKTA